MNNFYCCFKIAADLCILASKIIVFKKMKRMRTVSGISLKANILMMLSYLCIYTDPLDWNSLSFWNVYNNLIKVAMVEYQIGLFLFIYYRFYKTYEKRDDKCSVWFIFIISLLFGIFTSHKTHKYYTSVLRGYQFKKRNFYSFWSILKNSGHCLNALSIIPQLVMTQESGSCEAATGRSIILQGTGNALMLVYNICACYYTSNRLMYVFLGVVTLIINLDFMLIYYKSMMVNIESKMNVKVKKINEKVEKVKNYFRK
ncbi:erd-2 [Ecytonucleospora hepatopenaei]|uniref:Erd-2 n=1 Tax=Ecytonucleospora hepatopenaei TaxID=646526 RepID=A0A1W0E5C2_9MICR|nr:erd-2 [Ecytonucleospora hepatopenaei]